MLGCAGNQNTEQNMSLWAWGASSLGQLGLGTVTEQEGVPVEVAEHPVVDGARIVGGGGHTLLCDKEVKLFQKTKINNFFRLK